MEERNPKSILKTVLIVIAAFVVMILYMFISSAVEGRNYKGKTSEMYGTDSLEYVGEPVMKIFVWQRNEEDSRTNERYLSGSSYFYDLVPLTLTEGEKISTALIAPMMLQLGIVIALIMIPAFMNMQF